LSSNVGFRFWFHPTEYFHQKGFIPLSRAPSFFENWQFLPKTLGRNKIEICNIE
jgi:hypothetical protein